MLTARRSLSPGLDGVVETLAVMNRLRDQYGQMPAIHAAAIAIGASGRDDDQGEQVVALAQFVKAAVVYRQDPLNTELMKTPDVMLADIVRHGRTTGDCDDHVLLFATLCESVGIPCDIAGVASPGSDTINHVIAVAHPLGASWDIDLCAKDGPQPPYPEKVFAP